MLEKMPQFEEKEKPLKDKKEAFSYWALLESTSDKSVAESVKNIAKRKKALVKLQEMGWENFEDFKIHGINIDSIVKGSRERKGLWEKYSAFGNFPAKTVETINGQIDLSGPVFGAKPEAYKWKAVLSEESLTPEKTYFTLDIALLDEKKPWETREGADEIIEQIEKNIKKNKLDISFPFARSLGQEALRRALPDIFKEIKKYIWEKCYPLAAVDKNVANLEFRLETEISREIDQAREAEIIEGLKKREFDEKIFYLGAGAEKYLEYLKSEENLLSNFELQLMKKSLDKLVPFINKRTIYDLGPANALKVIPLLEKQLETQEEVEYVPIDINPAMIFAAAANINNPKVKVEGKILDFTKPMAGKLEIGSKFFTLLGNTLGNGDENYQKGLLKNINQAMTAADYLMVGIHLKSDWQEILKSYESKSGREVFLTAVENIGFPLAKIDLEIIADQKNRQIKAIVKIKEDLQVKGVDFKQGENLTIFVSQKYEVGELAKLAQSAGLDVEKTFLDEKNQYELAVLRKGK
ncbi:MAG: L-histidine N(alpha)-methyltransferase [Patescibacteria group bacterium]